MPCMGSSNAYPMGAGLDHWYTETNRRGNSSGPIAVRIPLQFGGGDSSVVRALDL